jgi:hypothetical protein
MVQISRKDLERLAIAFGIADFLSGGKLAAPIGNASRRALLKAGPAIARGIVRYGPTAALTAARVTPTPLAAAAVGATICTRCYRKGYRPRYFCYSGANT